MAKAVNVAALVEALFMSLRQPSPAESGNESFRSTRRSIELDSAPPPSTTVRAGQSTMPGDVWPIGLAIALAVTSWYLRGGLMPATLAFAGVDEPLALLTSIAQPLAS